MRSPSTAFALLSLGLLIGCNAGTPVVTATEVAPKQVVQQHNYRLYGNPEKGEFMVDAETGKVWQYKQKGDQAEFVVIPRQETTSAATSPEVWERNSSGKLVCTKNCYQPTMKQ